MAAQVLRIILLDPRLTTSSIWTPIMLGPPSLFDPLPLCRCFRILRDERRRLNLITRVAKHVLNVPHLRFQTIIVLLRRHHLQGQALQHFPTMHPFRLPLFSKSFPNQREMVLLRPILIIRETPALLRRRSSILGGARPASQRRLARN